jgi:hypothetical protein
VRRPPTARMGLAGIVRVQDCCATRCCANEPSATLVALNATAAAGARSFEHPSSRF